MISQLELPVTVSARSGSFVLRRAQTADLPAIVDLIYSDPVSAARNDHAPIDDAEAYMSALASVLDDPRNDFIVVANDTDTAVGCLQLTTIPGLSRGGATRVIVESVRVAASLRSAGIGSALLHWVTDTAAPSAGAALVQLTSDQQRTDARRFYVRLGFEDSHVGFKYYVTQ